MRTLLVLGCALVFFLAGATQVRAVAGTGPIGSPCGDNNLRYRGSPVTADLDFTKSTCQTQEFCRAHAPTTGAKKGLFYWDPQSPDCSNAQAIPGGCCAYYKLPPPPPPVKGSAKDLFNPIEGVTSLYGLINRVITVFLGIVGALLFAVFVYSGFLWMTAGSSDRVKAAQDAMKYAVMGLALIAFSYMITTTIISALANRGSATTDTQATTPAATPQELTP
jgi:hypothetical protein